MPPTTGHGRAGAGRDAQRDAVEPAPDRSPVADGGGAADEDQERGLEGVLGVVIVAQDRVADAEDHRPVPLDQDGERPFGDLLGAFSEPAQEFGVGQAADAARVEEHLDIPKDGFVSIPQHCSDLRDGSSFDR